MNFFCRLLDAEIVHRITRSCRPPGELTQSRNHPVLVCKLATVNDVPSPWPKSPISLNERARSASVDLETKLEKVVSSIRRRDQHAFTLIETIIAMSLLSLLMVIVWTMFSVYTKLEAKGVVIAQESGLARAIDRQFRRDILHMVAIDQQREVPIDPGLDKPSNQYASNGYLVGTATDLHVVVCAEPKTPGAADHTRVISYEPRSIIQDSDVDSELDQTKDALLGPEANENFATEFSEENGTPLGINRNDRAWSRYWEQRSTSDSSELAISTNRPITLDSDDFIQVGGQALDDASEEQRFVESEDQTDEIPEVQRLSFRYYDGRSWTSQWDSTSSRRLPLAIEIGFDLELDKDDRATETIENTQQLDATETRIAARAAGANADTIKIGDSDQIDDSVTTEYRFVVLVPAASKTTQSNDELDEPPTQEGFE